MPLDAVVLDIEGTTSSTWFVHQTLYPYSRERFRAWIGEHADEREADYRAGCSRRRWRTTNETLVGVAG